MHATDSPRTVCAPSFRPPRTLNTTAREHSGHHSCAALRCTALAPRGSRPRMTMRRVLGSPRRPRPGAQDQGPGYFGVTSHQQQQATRSGFARCVGGPTRRRGTPAPVASGEKVEGEHTGAEGPCLFELVVRGRALDHVHLSPSADAQVQGICTDEVARYRVRRNALMLRWAWVIHVDRVCHACVCDKFIPTRNCLALLFVAQLPTVVCIVWLHPFMNLFFLLLSAVAASLFLHL
jgi:hypothetical protein